MARGQNNGAVPCGNDAVEAAAAVGADGEPMHGVGEDHGLAAGEAEDDAGPSDGRAGAQDGALVGASVAVHGEAGALVEPDGDDETGAGDAPAQRRRRRGVESGYIKNRMMRNSCFSKRRKGLFKKARELHELTNAHVVVVVVSENPNVYAYTSPGAKELLSVIHESRQLASLLNDTSERRSRHPLVRMEASDLKALQEADEARLADVPGAMGMSYVTAPSYKPHHLPDAGEDDGSALRGGADVAGVVQGQGLYYADPDGGDMGAAATCAARWWRCYCRWRRHGWAADPGCAAWRTRVRPWSRGYAWCGANLRAATGRWWERGALRAERPGPPTSHRISAH